MLKFLLVAIFLSSPAMAQKLEIMPNVDFARGYCQALHNQFHAEGIDDDVPIVLLMRDGEFFNCHGWIDLTEPPK